MSTRPLRTPIRPAIAFLLYQKNWIDTVQWHLEDIIRSPAIRPDELVAIKRRIDQSNQDRTDTVEQIDGWFYGQFVELRLNPAARLNSETPAWLLDRMSILQLKLYHFREQVERPSVSDEHRQKAVKNSRYCLNRKAIWPAALMNCWKISAMATAT